MADIDEEASKLSSMFKKIQELNQQGEDRLGYSNLEEIINEISLKLIKAEDINQKKLGVWFAFLLWHQYGTIVAYLPLFNKLFDFRYEKAILKSSKTDEETEEKIASHSLKGTEVINWVSLPQPGTPGTMRVSAGNSFVKKIVEISKGAGGGIFGSVSEDVASEKVTKLQLDLLPNPDLCLSFAQAHLQKTTADFKDNYEVDEDGEELQRNNDLDDMF